MNACSPYTPLILSWRLRQGASIEPQGEAGVLLSISGGGSITIPPHPSLRQALLGLGTGISEDRLLTLAGEEGAPLLFYTLSQLVRLGLLEASADLDGIAAIRLVPRRRDFRLPRPCALPRRVVLDRFAYLRRSQRGTLLQLPGAPCDLILEHRSCGGLIALLAGGPFEAAEPAAPIDRALLLLLTALGFVTDAEADESPARQTWEFHDRLFHRATRSYDDGIVRGGSYRFRDELPPLSALRPPYPGPTMALPTPNPEQLARSRSLYTVMERRRSLRVMAAEAVNLDEVGEVFHRVARVTAILPPGEDSQQFVMRPYPSAGAIHELEFYLAVRLCTGLPEGFYHYRGDLHALTRLVGAENAAVAMLNGCARAWGQADQPPQVLVVIASRLPRLAWKYQGIAYRLSLLNAGVVLQSLYLVATDLGLAGAAAGSGDPDQFALATMVDPWEETSIAEFGFGRPA